MKKFLFVLFGLFAFSGVFAAGENVPTSKSYVDSKLVEKQDNIIANDTPKVLTNTGTAGEYGTKGIYDANSEYATQQNSLVDAAAMNAGVQNAIDSEFQCIEWLDPNDHSSDCLLMDVFGQTEHRSPNLFDVSKIPEYFAFGGDGGFIANNGDGTISVRGRGIWCSKTLADLAPEMVAGKTYTLNFDSNYSTGYNIITFLLHPSVHWGNHTSLLITEEMLNARLYFYSGSSTETRTLSNIQITEGTTAVPYVPYGNIYLPAAE